MRISTIGFTQKTAEQFFGALSTAGVKRVIDVRLKNVSQLAGFAKKQDLPYFLDRLCGAGYVHLPVLAPTPELMDELKKRGGDWTEYEQQFLDLMATRRIEQTLDPELLADACLLCSEREPHHCHRRLVAEYLRDHWGDVEIEHLG